MSRYKTVKFVAECAEMADRLESLIGRIEEQADACAERLETLSEMYRAATGLYRELALKADELAGGTGLQSRIPDVFGVRMPAGNAMKN